MAKPLNEYQKFINECVARLKTEADHQGKKYMELRAVANAEWRKDHPVDETKVKATKPRAPRKKKDKKEKKEKAAAAADGAEEATSADAKKEKKVKVKRAPSAYNMFISGVLTELKKEYEGKSTKPDQKELMKLAAERWRAHKALNPKP